MSGKAASNMAYIQQLFTTVGHNVSNGLAGEPLFSFLNAEPAEFRSIAYESASLEIAIKDIKGENSFAEWQEFYQHSKDHSFHVLIGLGWAFGKTETYPLATLAPPGSLMRLMIYDGIGYFNGLFRGRKTIKNQIISEGINVNELKGFDQGLGRRLWYLSQGNVNSVSDYIMAFPNSRQSDLWQGVGIACGYVGGNSITNLQMLSEASGIYFQQLCTGITLATGSRYVSNTMTPDIDSTCEIICKMTVEEILAIKKKLIDQTSVVDSNNFVSILEKIL